MKRIVSVLLPLLLFVPLMSMAAQLDGGNSGNDLDGGASGNPPLDGGNSGNPTQPSNPSTGGSSGGGSVTINNPLGEGTTITSFFIDILQILLIFAIPLIVFFIILSGFRLVTAQGNESQITEAKRALLYAIIGGLLILGANLILEVIQGTIDAFVV